MEETDPRSSRFTALFERHYDAVLRYAQRRIEPTAAVDVAAEVFLVAWRRLDDLPRDALPWLLVTARHTLGNHRRSAERTASLRVRLQAEPYPTEDLGAGVVDDLATRRRWARAIAALSPAEQEVLALAVWDGLTATQAARVVGCGVSAYVMRLHRTRRRLRRLLSETDEATDRWLGVPVTQRENPT